MPLIGYLAVSLVIFGLDQLVKYLVVTHIKLDTTVSFIPHVLSLSNVRNDGAAWSILQGQQLLLFVITVAALVVMLVLLKKNRNDRLFAWALTLMVGGTLGNFLDRLRLGYVVDMFTFDFMNFPIFNVADCALTVGVILLIIALFTGDDNE